MSDDSPYVGSNCVLVKPSVQKLVTTLSQECLAHMVEEAVHTDGYTLETPQIEQALKELAAEFSPSFVNQQLLIEACNKAPIRAQSRRSTHEKTVRIGIFEQSTNFIVPSGSIDPASRRAASHSCEFPKSMYSLAEYSIASGDTFKWQPDSYPTCFDVMLQFHLTSRSFS